MAISVRRATTADVDVVCDFNRRLAEESEGKILDSAILRAGVRAALSDPGKGWYFLGEAEGRVLGQMGVTFEWSDWRNGWFWWIQSVYVAVEARRRGVFKEIFNHILEAARDEREVIGLRLYVDHDNQAAQTTYQNMG